MKQDKLLVVGAGLSGATVARLAAEAGIQVDIVDKREHIAGNCYTEAIHGIIKHVYGAHIFHTNNAGVWEFVNRFAEFDEYTHRVAAVSRGNIYPMPINCNTLRLLELGQSDGLTHEQLLAVAIERLFKGYSEKQWGVPFDKIPGRITSRVAARDSFNDLYFLDRYQGVPRDGYTAMVANMLDHENIRLMLNTKCHFNDAKDYRFTYWSGETLDDCHWRSVRFEDAWVSGCMVQPTAVVNYTDPEVPFTRQIEHKQFMSDAQLKKFNTVLDKTLITTEYPCDASDSRSIGQAYPRFDGDAEAAYAEFMNKHKNNHSLLFGGRLGSFTYLDMDKAINQAMKRAKQVIREFMPNC